MTTRKKTTKETGKGTSRKLKLKKATVKDLDVKGSSGRVKGGEIGGTIPTIKCVSMQWTCKCYAG